MEAIDDIHSKEYLVQKLEHLRDDFHDEIPAEVVHSSSPDNKFKAQRGWFHLVAGYLKSGLDDGYISDPTLKEKIEGFVEWCHEGEFKKMGYDETLTREEDIVKANDVINSTLANLAPKPPTI